MPVLLKGEMMKGNMIYGFMLIILLFMIKPLYGEEYKYTVEGQTITVPDSGRPTRLPSKEIEKRLMPQMRSSGSNNEVIYQGNIGEIISEEYCRNINDPKIADPAQYKNFWIEFKYYDTLMDKNEFFEKEVITVNGLPIIKDRVHQLISTKRGDSLDLSFRFKLKNNWLYSDTPKAIKIKQGDALGVITMLCVNKEYDTYSKDEWNSKYNSFTFLIVKAAKEFEFQFARTCWIAEKEQTIKLKDVTVKELNEKTEVLGGRFNIKLNCPTQSVKNAYIIFTDAIDSTNTGRDIGMLSSPETMTTKTVLTVKDAVTNQPLVYRQPLPRNGGFFGVPEEKNDFYTFSQSLQQGQVSRTYKVYYRKLSPNRSVQPGEISAKMTYNIYYN
ncbi:fimbrial protein [Gallibacterium anatis]|uniref:fimbrial protein n=1 Tax=Gallibacterium anatis TaxID=750 RepID=UPI00117BDC30|nr:type 1 fimbrial protein [Gallibacterium anatis]